MEIIKFNVEGLFNSFRHHEYKKYHPTYLFPPKLTILGMIANLLGYGEDKFYKWLNQNDFKTGIVINDIQGTTKDLWGYKNYKSGLTRGKGIVRRDKLFGCSYTIYLYSEKLEELYAVLKFPVNAFSLGMDDELISIRNVEKVFLEKRRSKNINSIFLASKNYETYINSEIMGKTIIYPRKVTQTTKLSDPMESGKRTQRTIVEQKDLIEYFNCTVKFCNDQDTYYDRKNDNYLDLI